MKEQLKNNIELEICLTKIARAIYGYVLTQKDIKNLELINPLFDNFYEVTMDYCHDRNGRLFEGDLALNISIWINFKLDLLRAKSEKNEHLPIQEYADSINEMIEYLEKLYNLKK